MKAKARLVITGVTWNTENQPRPGTALIFSITIKNVGPEDLPAGTKQSTGRVFVDHEMLPEIKYNGALAVGESKTFESKVWMATSGNHVVTATIDFAVPSPDNFGTGVTFAKNLRVADEALPVPALAVEAGMNILTFSDDFTTLDTIDVNATGDMGYKWYPTRPYGENTLKPTDYEITDNGILLKEEEGAFNYGLGMLDIRTGAGWGYTHGYMETRFRMQPDRMLEGTKGIPAIWALPPDTLWCRQNEHVEMDFMEYWGTMFVEKHLYTVTMHHQESKFCQDKPGTEVVLWAKNDGTAYHHGLNDADWHVMGWLWGEGYITTYVDGREIMTQKWSKEGYPEPQCTVTKGELRPGIFSVMDEQLLPVTISGAAGWTMEVDYLNIWQSK